MTISRETSSSVSPHVLCLPFPPWYIIIWNTEFSSQTPVGPSLFSSQCLAQGQGQLPVLLDARRLPPYLSWRHKMISGSSADIRRELDICVVPHKYHCGPLCPFATHFIYRSDSISPLLHAYACYPLRYQMRNPQIPTFEIKKNLKIYSLSGVLSWVAKCDLSNKKILINS